MEKIIGTYHERERGFTQSQEGEEYLMYNKKRGRLPALVTSSVRTNCFLNALLKKRWGES